MFVFLIQISNIYMKHRVDYSGLCELPGKDRARSEISTWESWLLLKCTNYLFVRAIFISRDFVVTLIGQLNYVMTKTAPEATSC